MKNFINKNQQSTKISEISYQEISTIYHENTNLNFSEFSKSDFSLTLEKEGKLNNSKKFFHNF